MKYYFVCMKYNVFQLQTLMWILNLCKEIVFSLCKIQMCILSRNALQISIFKWIKTPLSLKEDNGLNRHLPCENRTRPQIYDNVMSFLEADGNPICSHNSVHHKYQSYAKGIICTIKQLLVTKLFYAIWMVNLLGQFTYLSVFNYKFFVQQKIRDDHFLSDLGTIVVPPPITSRLAYDWSAIRSDLKTDCSFIVYTLLNISSSFGYPFLFFNRWLYLLRNQGGGLHIR